MFCYRADMTCLPYFLFFFEEADRLTEIQKKVEKTKKQKNYQNVRVDVELLICQSCPLKMKPGLHFVGQ